MSAIDVPDHGTRPIVRRARAILPLTAAGLFLGSAVLQLVASLQRWVMFSDSPARGKISAEDHLFDYYFPHAPWENIGTAAQFFGAGTLILALGVVVMALGVVAMPSEASRGGIVAIIEIAIAVLVAGSFGINGAHAFLSGVSGAPSALQSSGALGWVGVIGLTVLGMGWLRTSPAAMAACMFLIGSTGVGYLIVAIDISPILAGGVSYDTTRWTETVIAASTAAAGIAMLIMIFGLRARLCRSNPG